MNPTDWFDGLPTGSLADWFAAVGTLAAFFIALIVYTQSRKDAKRSQARLVHAYLADVGSISEGDQVAFPIDQSVSDDDHFELSVEDGRPGVDAYAKRALIVLIVKVANNSNEIVTRLEPRLFATHAGDQNDEIPLADVPFLAPGTSVERFATFGMGELKIGGEMKAAVSFVDSSGRHWYRDQLRPLRRAHRRDRIVWTRESEA